MLRTRSMNGRPLLAFLLPLFVLFNGCGGDDGPMKPPPVDPPPPALLFHEPRSFCLSATDSGDTLFLHNLGDSAIDWNPVSVPNGSTNLSGSFTIQKGTIVALIWTWNPPTPGLDSLVVTTHDPDPGRIVVMFRKEATGYVDIDPPGKPVPGAPEDGAVVFAGSTIELFWSRVSDCSGIALYQIQIALEEDFALPVFDETHGLSSVGLIVEEDEMRGRAYWRVRAKDRSPAGLFGPWSDVRSWIVQ